MIPKLLAVLSVIVELGSKGLELYAKIKALKERKPLKSLVSHLMSIKPFRKG